MGVGGGSGRRWIQWRFFRRRITFEGAGGTGVEVGD